ncbi:MAG: hypothetical protein IPF41_06000 [Flavobacteriales bacterium]|nr:hypothetical protein [Flavobacteriales bacterium]
MSFTHKPSLPVSVDQVIGLVEQLSPKDKRKVVHALRKEQLAENISRLHEIWGRVKLSEKEIAAVVEEVRAARYERRKAAQARR